MEVESSICLSDLVPALRWSRPQQVAEALGDPRLPAGWWSSLALSKALGTAGLDWICERLARLASSRWDHLPLADLLPALTVHHIDPSLPGWPEATRTAITGLGGWQRLRRLSPSDLSTPSATPEVVIGSVFREILGRIPAQREAPAAVQAGHPEVTRPLQRGQASASPGTGSFAAPQPPATTGSFAAVQGQAGAGEPRQTGSFPAVQQPAVQQPADPRQSGSSPLPAAADGGPTRQTGSFPAVQQPPERQGGAFPGGQDRQTGSFPAVQQPADPRQNGPFPGPQQPSEQQQSGPFPGAPADRQQQRQAGPFAGGQDRQTGSFPAVQPSDPRQSGSPAPQSGPFPGPQQPSEQRQTGSFPAVPAEGAPGPRETGAFAAQSGSFPAQPQSGAFPAQPQGGGPRQGLAGEGGLPQRPVPDRKSVV